MYHEQYYIKYQGSPYYYYSVVLTTSTASVPPARAARTRSSEIRAGRLLVCSLSYGGPPMEISTCLSANGDRLSGGPQPSVALKPARHPRAAVQILDSGPCWTRIRRRGCQGGCSLSVLENGAIFPRARHHGDVFIYFADSDSCHGLRQTDSTYSRRMGFTWMTAATSLPFI